MFIPRPAATIVLAGGIFVARISASAQNNVGPGEQRFNVPAYKASHNSYERNESLNSQIDDWNCWCLELDLIWHTNNEIYVEHSCSVPNSQNLLLAKLQQAAASLDAAKRVTVVYLELKSSFGPYCTSWPQRSVYRNYIRAQAETALGAARIYTSVEFKTLDQYRWASYQELLRRGYNWIIVLDEEATGFADDDFFFGMVRGNPPTQFEPNSVLMNSGNPSTPVNRGAQPDRWLARVYPPSTCGSEGAAYINDGVLNGYNLVATNCINQAHTMQPPTHSPAPLHVAAGGTGTQYGTLAYPFRGAPGLMAAVQRASPMVPLSIAAGTYDIPNPTDISRPVVLTSAGGAVTLH